MLGVVSCAFGAFFYFGFWIELRVLGCVLWVGFVVSKEGVVSLVGGKLLSKEKVFLDLG